MKKYKLIILYVLLIGGGTWHILGIFGTLMHHMAAPLIIGLGIWLFLENWFTIIQKNSPKSSGRYELLLWSIFIIVTSMFIEALGVKTGLIFGPYEYGTSLSPYVGGVPLSIGFAWLTMLFSSAGIVQFFFPKNFRESRRTGIILIGLLMTLFDFFMEPAAIKLNYWNWSENSIPLQNYFAWFLISVFFAWIGYQTKVLTQKLSKFCLHVYLAQLIYFILIYFS